MYTSAWGESHTLAGDHPTPDKHTRWGGPGKSYLELGNEPPGLQVQRVLVEAQLPLHHLLVMKLKLDVAARRNVDLGLKRLQFLRVRPVVHRRFSVYDVLGFFLNADLVPDDACCFAFGSGLRVQVPGHRLLLHGAHEGYSIHIPATGQEEGGFFLHMKEEPG